MEPELNVVMHTEPPARSPASALDALPDVLTPPEVAKVLRVGRNQAYELIRQGLVPSFRIGCRIRIAKRALLEFVHRQGESIR